MIFEQLAKMKIVPVITLYNTEDAVPLAKALCESGLPCAEVTFRTDAAADAIRKMTSAFPQMLVGAGTILSPAQADCAIAAGAKFLVSPGLNPDTVRHCIKMNFPFIPGVCTPSEVEQGISLGLDVLKFFPAEAAGGIAMLRAILAPYGAVRFMPTGGISPKNLPEYLALKNVIACGGSWMVPPNLIEAGNFAEISRLTREAVKGAAKCPATTS